MTGGLLFVAMRAMPGMCTPVAVSTAAMRCGLLRFFRLLLSEENQNNLRAYWRGEIIS